MNLAQLFGTCLLSLIAFLPLNAQENDPNPMMEFQSLEVLTISKDPVSMVQVCKNFTHANKEFEAKVKALGSKVAGNLLEIQNLGKQRPAIDKEITRLRRNADVSDHPNPLNANDKYGGQRAASLRQQAEDMDSGWKNSIEELKEDSANQIKALGLLIAETKRKLNRKKLEDKISKAGTTSRPRFADAAVPAPSPTYDETISFINAKLAQRNTRCVYDGSGDSFTLVDSEGSQSFQLSKLSPSIKHSAETAEYHYIVLESMDVTQPLTASELGSNEVERVRSVRIVCNDYFDAQKLAKAFNHLILMAGGKPDLF